MNEQEGQFGGPDSGGTGKGDGGASGPGDGSGGGGPPGAELAQPIASPEDFPGASLDERLRAATDEVNRQRSLELQSRLRAEALVRELAQTENALSEAREALDQAERRHQIDLLLIESEAIDMESARLLTELYANQSEGSDIASAIEKLKQSKPFLFRPSLSPRGVPGPAMSAASAASGGPLADAAEEAARTGDRSALLRYLRARRTG